MQFAITASSMRQMRQIKPKLLQDSIKCQALTQTPSLLVIQSMRGEWGDKWRGIKGKGWESKIETILCKQQELLKNLLDSLKKPNNLMDLHKDHHKDLLKDLNKDLLRDHHKNHLNDLLNSHPLTLREMYEDFDNESIDKRELLLQCNLLMIAFL